MPRCEKIISLCNLVLTVHSMCCIYVGKTHAIIAGLKKVPSGYPVQMRAVMSKGAGQSSANQILKKQRKEVHLPRASVLPLTALKCWLFNDEFSVEFGTSSVVVGPCY